MPTRNTNEDLEVGENQYFNYAEIFFQQGVFLPSRKIIIGSPKGDPDGFINHQDLSDLTKILHLLELDSNKLISITLNTGGGNLYDAWGIYDIIRSCRSPVEILVAGECSSAGTVILQAADTRLSYKNTMFLIHEPVICSTDNSRITPEQSKTQALDLKRDSERMINFYLDNFKITKKKLLEYLANGQYFDAKEAKKIGLIDEIL